MNLLEIKDLLNNHYENSYFEVKNNIILGKLNSFDVELASVIGGLKLINVLHILVNRNIKQDEYEVINCLKIKGLTDCSNIDVISIKLIDLESSKEEVINEFLNKLDSLFKVLDEFGLTEASICHICLNKIDTNKIICFRQSSVYGAVLGICHEECLNKVMNEEKEEIEKNNNNTSRLPLAISLCSIFGIIYGLLVFLLCSKVNVFFSFILYVLTPISSVIYLLTKAPNKKYQLWIILGSSLLGLISYSVMFLIFNELDIYQVLINLAISLLFVGAGSITTIKSILANTNDKKLEKME